MKEQITIPLSDYNRLLAKVSDLEVLTGQLTLQYQGLLSKHEILLGRHAELDIKYTKLIADNARLTFENERLTCENVVLKETVLHLRNQIFGKKKDKIENGSNIRDLNKTRNEKIAKKRGRKPISPEYQVDEVRRYDYASNTKCSVCQLEMHYAGSNNSHHEDYQVVFKKVKIVQAKYACRCCNKIVVGKRQKITLL